MTDKKYCYRYVDGNDSQGRPIVMLWERVILRETEKTFWHVHDMPYTSLEGMRSFLLKPGSKQVKRCLKNAARSGYHLTKEQAMQAFIYRKAFQLNRLWLTAETVELCLKGLQDAGHVSNVSLDDGLQINRRGEVISVPNGEFLAATQPGPIASTYSWGEH
ncbi:hypothetical protein JEM67_16155 [Serratia sp. PAMC26656]|uniref:hypothetical protein n=1 Tax=Serratia sp. PAMC26656 TaxID=2775909 RepID=UPI0018F4BECF|nr:hypothetical protein [Serratia sp. PAMC26656]MBJ7889411.1 hypothetical protein [Serratia sp. PAMC26656]